MLSSTKVDAERHPSQAFDFDVSVLGLGAMGARMAQALVARGKRVAVWNRSPSKAKALEASGAHLCESAEAAFTASPVSILVFLDNDAVHDVLATVDHRHAFANRTIVNYTTNSKDESLALQALFDGAGGHYIKGAIVAYPRNIGHPDSYSILSGDAEAFERCRDLLEVIAANALFLPWEEAYALSVTLHVHAFAAMTSFYEAVAASPCFGMPPSKMARLIADASRFLVTDAIQDAVHRLETGNFAGDQARLDVHESAFEYLAEAMHARGASIPVFDAVCAATRNAQSMGCGDEDIAAMVKAFAPEAAATTDIVPERRSEH